MAQNRRRTDKTPKEKTTDKTPQRKRPSFDDRLGELQERLYSRGNPPIQRQRRKLSSSAQGASEAWQNAPEASAPEVAESAGERTGMFVGAPSRHSLRRWSLLGGGAFFGIALIVSVAFLLLGQNTISGDNITIDIKGPFVIGGGEELDLQIAIANRNAVPIESATLIISYPPGTQSADDAAGALTRERLSLDSIASGEVLNVPVRATVFGEENEEKQVSVAVEYRVGGSNATFSKDAEPFRFKISSSPVVASVEGPREITSGQEVSFDIIVSSNATNEVSDILVEADYPTGFEYTGASVDPVAGSNIWRIDTLEPSGSETITVRGIMSGAEKGEHVFNFRVGVSSSDDAFALASVFSTTDLEMTLQRAFVDLVVNINSSNEGTIALSREENVSGNLTFTNTLSDTIYDGVIEVRVTGNALNEGNVLALNGEYNSNTDTITWHHQNLRSLRTIVPGAESNVSFTLKALTDEGLRTPQLEIAASVRGKRVSEDRVPEELTNSVVRTVKFESVLGLDSYAVYSTGPFDNAGPIQPVAEEITQYTFFLTAENGSNDVTDAQVTARLPSYVTWLDLVTSGDTVRYNSETREITWDIGDMGAHTEAEVAFQMSILPSQTQVGSVPVMLEQQRFRATDRFTGTVVRTDAAPITTKIEEDPNEDGHIGTVREE